MVIVANNINNTVEGSEGPCLAIRSRLLRHSNSVSRGRHSVVIKSNSTRFEMHRDGFVLKHSYSVRWSLGWLVR